MSAISKKIFGWLTPFLVIPLILPVAFFVPAKKVNAQFVPVTDIPALPSHTNNAIQNTSRTLKEFTLDYVVTAIAKTIIKQISQATVQWINSGFKGSPAFIQDPGQFFTGVADRVAGQFIEDIGLGFLCEPFRLNIQLQLALDYGGPNGNFETGCTLSDIAGNIEGFLDGDFTQGGWDNWFNITQNRGNNPYGAYIQAKTALEIKIATAQGVESMKLNWFDGFFPQEVCDDYDSPGDYAENDPSRQALNCKIVTPGSVIEDQLVNVLGSDLRQLELADEINEILGALVGQLITQVMSATGLAGAGGGSSYDQGFSTGGGYSPDYAGSIADAEDLYNDTVSDSTPDDLGFGNTGDTNETGNVNLAQGNLAMESGTGRAYENSYRAELAVDGNRDTNLSGTFANIAVTERVDNAWWQVDLEGTRAIKEIRVYSGTDNDTDLGNTNMGAFKVFVSSSPFVCEQTAPYSCLLNGALFDPLNPPASIVTRSFDTMPTVIPFVVPINATGRYVRIQRVDAATVGPRRLHLAEVEVYRNNAPVITLNGSSRITLEQGGTYTEQSATAFDQSDADRGINAGVIEVTRSVAFNNTPVTDVNTSVIGTYTITYTATDSGGAVGRKTRTVVITEPN